MSLSEHRREALLRGLSPWSSPVSLIELHFASSRHTLCSSVKSPPNWMTRCPERERDPCDDQEPRAHTRDQVATGHFPCTSHGHSDVTMRKSSLKDYEIMWFCVTSTLRSSSPMPTGLHIFARKTYAYLLFSRFEIFSFSHLFVYPHDIHNIKYRNIVT